MKIDFFTGRTVLVATKHGKEKVISSIVEDALHLKTWTPADYDTDIFGTFTGEKERQNDPLTTARQKCLMALEKYNYDLAIASEGSFGPHPSWSFLPCDEEYLILIDTKNNLEFFIREISTETNFAGSVIQNTDQLQSFAESVFFPSHALIIKDKKEHFKEVRKGIEDWFDLFAAYDHFMHLYGQVYAETDMRAHKNPTRMQVIQKAAELLSAGLLSLCPSCGYPGFIVRQHKTGLPCKICRQPTKSTLSQTSICQHCGYSEEKWYPHGKTNENPGYCDFCNP